MVLEGTAVGGTGEGGRAAPASQPDPGGRQDALERAEVEEVEAARKARRPQRQGGGAPGGGGEANGGPLDFPFLFISFFAVRARGVGVVSFTNVFHCVFV